MQYIKNLNEFIKDELTPFAYDKANEILNGFNFVDKTHKKTSANHILTRKHDHNSQTAFFPSGAIFDANGIKLHWLDVWAIDNNLQNEPINAQILAFCKAYPNAPQPQTETNENAIKTEQKRQLLDDLTAFCRAELENNTNKIKSYLEGRKISKTAQIIGKLGAYDKEKTKNYLLSRGHDPEDVANVEKKLFANGVLIPYFDLNGRTIGAKVRAEILDKTGKKTKVFPQLATPDKIENLYLFNRQTANTINPRTANELNTGQIIVFDGELKTLQARANGFFNAVASYGKNGLTDNQIKTAQRFGVKQILFCPDIEDQTKDAKRKFDNIANIKKQCAQVVGAGLAALIITLPARKDGQKIDVDDLLIIDNPADALALTPEETGKTGKEIFENRIKNACSFYNWVLELYAEEITTPADALAFIQKYAHDFCAILNQTEIKSICELFAQYTKTTPADVFAIFAHELDAIKDNKRKAQHNEIKQLFETFEKSDFLGDYRALFNKIDKYNNNDKKNADKLKYNTQNLFCAQSFADYLQDVNQNDEILKTSFAYTYKRKDKEKKYFLSFPAGALSILGALTSHGKTSFACNLALDAILNQLNTENAKNIYFFSFEESRKDVTTRFILIFLSKNQTAREIIFRLMRANPEQETPRNLILRILRGGKVRTEPNHPNDPKMLFGFIGDFFALDKLIINDQQSARELAKDKNLNDFIDNSGQIDEITKFCQLVEILANDGNTGAIFIDYIQLFADDTANKGGTRQEQMKNICLHLRACALYSKVPIILNAQLSRELQKSIIYAPNPTASNPTPETYAQPEKMRADGIGEAGDVERVANKIYLIYNAQFVKAKFYNTLTGFAEDITNGIFVKCVKDRNGAGVGTYGIFSYFGEFFAIENTDENHPKEHPEDVGQNSEQETAQILGAMEYTLPQEPDASANALPF